ncbi:sirohydrochlorin chelatase [Labedaea rhizosphaerae]|uniref:Sirohydrochlorin ferrochelatase n=1 Tax=Labedaea rhizosphaerae TaxID=598644 RepID=A0A4V3CZ17_LABRH|nr:sirohydrochlorin chelatase [Labedaea rhizosphaerae]TDP96278.1 sirohydrochlorin ferrochelatase [Labedaea rhizosphaerae]
MSLVLVAHGSRDPRSAATIAALADVVRAARPGLDVRVAFLDLSAPRVGDVLAGLSRAVIVPLLLGRAFHADVDLPNLVHEAVARNPRLSVAVSSVLGPDPLLRRAAVRRLRESGVSLDDPSLGIVVAAAGSSRRSSTDAVHALARSWPRARAAFASAGSPTVDDAVAALRSAGARRLAVASWFLAPGRLPDRIEAAIHAIDPSAIIAEPLGPAPEVAELVLRRHDEAATEEATARYA